VVLVRRSGGRFEGLTEDYLRVTGRTDQALPARFDARLSIDPDGLLVAQPVEDGQ
jgi:hypothetical protein